MLAARLNRGRKLVRLCGAEYEKRPRRRLFQRFQQRVEGLRCQHVCFVDDENPVEVSSRKVADGFTKLADFINPAVRGGVDFKNIHRISLGNFNTRRAFAAGSHGRPLGAVQRLCQNARRGGLAHSPRTGKDVSVRDAPLDDGILQRVRDQPLAGNVIKKLRSVFAGDDLIRHSNRRTVSGIWGG